MATIVTRAAKGSPLTFAEADANFTNLNTDKAENASLSASTGSSLVGHIASGTGAVARTAQSVLRDSVSIKDFGATGGNLTLDSAALIAAVNSLGSKGGVIRLPATTNPYLFNSYVLADLGTGTNAIELVGDGLATKIQVGSACTNFITMQGAWSAIRNLQILDPNNYCTNGLIYIKPLTAQNLVRRIENVSGIGAASSTAFLIVNEGGQQIQTDNTYSQNLLGHLWNKSGGVDSNHGRAYGLGIKYGLRLDSDVTYGHAENFSCDNWTMLCTQVNSIAYWITDSLHFSLTNCVGAQLGSGGTGIYMDGITGVGSNLTFLNNCYFEGSNTSSAVKSRGNNARFHMIGGGLGQGGYSASVINCIDFDGVNEFVFDNVEAFFPSGNANKIATIENSSGTITETCKGWNLANNTSTEVASAVNWNVTSGAPTTRLSTSSYSKSTWSAWTPTVTSATGTITTVGAVDCAYRIDGKSCEFRASVTITTNGTGATGVFISLPVTSKTGKTFSFSGTENGVTGKQLQAIATGSGMLAKFYDNTYPASNGAILVITGMYETN
jgi:hypothetical protein